MRASFSCVVAASLLAAFCAGAAAALAPPAVELVRPRAGEVLTAGTEAVVEWRSLASTLDPTIEEWEAFLSFDGGGYYAVRLTPHLDASLRRFRFRVPDVVTRDARILLRFGDEVVEVGVETPHRFEIRASALADLPAARRIPTRGESARPGEPGVLSWVEGTRDGDGLALFESHPPSSAGAAMLAGPAAAVPALIPEKTAPVVLAASVRLPLPDPPAPPFELVSVFSPASILLLGCRRNE